MSNHKINNEYKHVAFFCKNGRHHIFYSQDELGRLHAEYAPAVLSLFEPFCEFQSWKSWVSLGPYDECGKQAFCNAYRDVNAHLLSEKDPIILFDNFHTGRLIFYEHGLHRNEIDFENEGENLFDRKMDGSTAVRMEYTICTEVQCFFNYDDFISFLTELGCPRAAEINEYFHPEFQFGRDVIASYRNYALERNVNVPDDFFELALSRAYVEEERDSSDESE